MEHDRILSVTIGRRPAGSEGETKAADYIESTFAAAGYTVERQPAKRLDGGISYNLIARPKNMITTQPAIVIGAHYDTVPISPGGNDNGTGVAVVLALAQELSGRALPVEFVAFGGEEIQPSTKEHHIGSRAFVAALSSPKDIAAVLSVDEVGFGVLDFIVYRGTSSALLAELEAAASSDGFTYVTHSKGDISDHGPFAKAGIPAVLVAANNIPEHHTANDTFDRVQRDAVDRAGRVVLTWLRSKVAV
jgi:Zn-dependent M28 family amino/carboxypeptidase